MAFEVVNVVKESKDDVVELFFKACVHHATGTWRLYHIQGIEWIAASIQGTDTTLRVAAIYTHQNASGTLLEVSKIIFDRDLACLGDCTCKGFFNWRDNGKEPVNHDIITVQHLLIKFFLPNTLVFLKAE